MAFAAVSRGRILTADRPGSVAYRACTSTSRCMCTESPPPCARQRCRMSLPALRLYHARTNGGAVPGSAVVAGATPPFGCLVRHGDGWDVHGHPTLPWGRSRSISPLREAQRPAGTGASRILARPYASARQLVVGSSGDGLRAVYVEERQGVPEGSPEAKDEACAAAHRPNVRLAARMGEVSPGVVFDGAHALPDGRIRRRVQRQLRAVCRRGLEGARPPASLSWGHAKCGHGEYAGSRPLTGREPAVTRHVKSL